MNSDNPLGLQDRDAQQVLWIVESLGLQLADPTVRSHVQAALNRDGMKAFDPAFCPRISCLEIAYDSLRIAPDRDSATTEIAARFGSSCIQWHDIPAFEQTIGAGFEFTTPDGWCGVLTHALGLRVRQRIHEIVLNNSQAVAIATRQGH